jgi:hypothetical protein
MIAGGVSARSLLAGCVLGPLAVSVLSGFIMAAAEAVTYSEGLWAVFNVITTVGFGDGPTSTSGQLIAAGAFVAVAMCWLGIVSVAAEVGLSRFERDALVREALRSPARRRGPKLFTTTDGGHAKRVPAAIGACILLVGGACSDVSFIDEVTIVNDTEYPAHVDVTDGTEDAWMGLTSVDPQSTMTVEEVIDQGEMWVFRFDYVGKYQEEVEVSRRELEQNGWTIDVPSSFEQGLPDLDDPEPT